MDAVGTWEAGEPRVRVLREPVRVTAWRPDIGGLLPVYVADRYEGVTARPYLECSDEEIEAYVAANVAAVRSVAARARPDAALANHLVMGPLIVARALGGAAPYAVKIHGSALEYVVKRDPERFLPAAREGLAGASAILCGSRHTAESLWAAMGDDELPARTRLGPPGVDVHEFRPRPLRRGGRRRPRARRAPAGGGRAGRPGAVGVQPRRAGRRARAGPPGPGARPPRGLHRQADRLQGRGPARGRVAARPARRARRTPRRRRLRRVPRCAGAPAGRPAGRRPRRRARDRGRRPRGRGRPARAAAPPARLPGSAGRRRRGPGGLPRGGSRAARARRADRAPRARRARAGAGRLRGPGRAQHVPRGVRDGRRGGRRLRRAPGQRRPFGAGRGHRPAAGRGAGRGPRLAGLRGR